MNVRTLAVLASVMGLAAPMSVVPAAHAEGVTFVSFDDVPPVCYFSETTALRDRYSAVKFKGPDENDGGAVLDNCSAYGIAPRTGSRFLAFASPGTMADGGLARGPEKMRLVTKPTAVEIWVSSAGGEATATFTLKGKLGTKTVRTATASVTQSGWVMLRVKNRDGLTSAILSSTTGTWLADDLLLTD